MKHEWQSSYAMDCRSMDPGANPGSCSTINLITAIGLEWQNLLVHIGSAENDTNRLYPLLLSELFFQYCG